MKELRQELDNIGVDYSSCIEKSEMFDLLNSKAPAVMKAKAPKKEAPKKLSIKSIKERLASLGVDYSGCLEISELVELLVATEQGHKTNPFREEKVEKVEKEIPKAAKVEKNEPPVKSENTVAEQAGQSNASAAARRVAPASRLGDITKSMNEQANRQQTTVKVAAQTSTHLKDIDARDKKNVQHCTEYVEDIYNFLRSDETKYMPGRFLEGQNGVMSVGQRAGVVDWIVEMHGRLRMQPAVLYLAINVLDRYLAALKDPPTSVTVVACACLLIAAKIEEIYPPKVRDMRKAVPSISATELTHMERSILNTLKFAVSVPTVFHFMKRYLKAAEADMPLKALTMYIVEVAMYDPVYHRFKPSLVASAAISLAMRMSGKVGWNSTLQHETKYGTSDLSDCINGLNGLLSSVSSAPMQHSVVTKYQAPKYFEVAKIDVIAV
jgi:hypothetical protein